MLPHPQRGGRSAPPPRVTFPPRGKSPKARQGLRPLESPGAWSPPFSRSLRCAPTRAGLPLVTNPDRFATLSLWANRSFFLPEIGRSHTFCYQTVARQRGPISGQLQRKQRKHRTFLTLFLYTILKYLFIKILCFRCSWLINGVIKPFVAAQNLHKTGTELHRTAQNSRPPPQHPFTYTPNPPKSCTQTCNESPTAPRINSRIFFLVKAKGNNKDRFAHHLKVANRSFSVAETSPARCVSEREKGGKGWL